MREAAVVDHTGVGLLQLEILSNDGDMFYAGCRLNRRVIGVERTDYSLFVPCIAGLSDSDRSAYLSGPWTEVGCLSMIFRRNRNPGEVQASFIHTYIHTYWG